MSRRAAKTICIPIDGSEHAKKSLGYIDLIFGSSHPLDITLLYILPTLPPILLEEKKKGSAAAKKLKEVEAKQIEVADKYLSEAKAILVEKGFKSNSIKTMHRQKEVGTAKDICRFSDKAGVDAVMISTKGRSRIQAFFMGEVSQTLLEHCPKCPIWLLEPVVRKKTALLCMDSSDNALRAADYAGHMLSGTDVPVILFHTKRNLRRFMPKEVFEDTPELEELWKHAAGEEIAPYMKEAKERLLKAGLSEDQISTKVVDGSRSAAKDILKAAKRYDCGTIIMGRRGLTGMKELVMGSVTRKVLEDLSQTAVWIVR